MVETRRGVGKKLGGVLRMELREPAQSTPAREDAMLMRVIDYAVLRHHPHKSRGQIQAEVAKWDSERRAKDGIALVIKAS